MKTRVEDYPDLQRLSVVGGVFYVSQTPKSPAPGPGPDAQYEEHEERPLPSHWPAATPEEYPTAETAAQRSGEPEPADREATGLESHGPQRPAAAESVVATPYDHLYVEPPPKGYAVEFGTGRLVRLQLEPNDGQLTYPKSGEPWN